MRPIIILRKDATSGTALATVQAIKMALGEKEIVYGREGLMPRGKESGVHAVRDGDIVGDHTVLFAGSGERLEIKHQAHSRIGLASGAVRVVGWVVCKESPVFIAWRTS